MSYSSKSGGTLPPLTKKISVLRQIQRGLVIKGYVPQIGHIKYYIFMGFSSDSNFVNGFFINSQPSAIILTNPKIGNLQIDIPPGSYRFLRNPKPSYINCLKYYQIDSIVMINGLIQSPSKMCGYLSHKHLWEVTQAVQNNPTFTVEEKNVVVDPLIFPSHLCPITSLL